MSKQKMIYETTGKERAFYPMYFVGQNIFFILITNFLSQFFLDIGITAIAVTGLFLVVKIWDAVNDPIFGGIVDKFRLKGGKFLPWLRISIFAIPVASLLLFAIPNNLSPTAKIAWAAIAYILWDTAYTICDVPIFGIVTTLSNRQEERAAILSYGRVAGVLSGLAVTVLVPRIREPVGGWLPMAILLAIIGTAVMLPICLTAKERVKPLAAEEDITLTQMFRFLIKNKYLLIFYVSFCMSQMAAVGTSLNIIAARELFGDEKVASQLTLMLLIPTVILGAFIPLLIRKIDKYYLYFGAVAVNALMSVIIFFVGYEDFTLYLILLVIKGIPFGMVFVLMFLFTPDCVEYGTYKSGVPSAGVGFSVQSFSTKLATALAVSLGTFSLSIIGFVEGEGAVQTAENFSRNLWFIYNILPAAGGLLSLVFLGQYKLRDKYVQVMMKANTGEITRTEAEEQLEGKF